MRQSLTVGTTTRDVVAVTHRGIQFFTVNPTTRLLQPITEGTAVGVNAEGLCLYRSAAHRQGLRDQHHDPGPAAPVRADRRRRRRARRRTVVRDFEVGSEAEGCVADDDTGALFVSEEDVALWKYDAEPDGGTARIAIDVPVAAGGNLTRTSRASRSSTCPAAPATSSRRRRTSPNPNNSFFAVYNATAPHAFVTTFRVTNGTSSDDCDRTDGVAATTGTSARPSRGNVRLPGQQQRQPGSVGNQDLKFVRLETVVDLTPGSNLPPIAAITPTCDGTVCTFDAVESVDPDGQVVGWSWNFGDGSPDVSGTPAVHDFGGSGTFAVTLTVTDEDGATDTATTNVQVAPAPDPTAPVSFVGSTASPNANTNTWSVTVPLRGGGERRVVGLVRERVADVAGDRTRCGLGAGGSIGGRRSPDDAVVEGGVGERCGLGGAGFVRDPEGCADVGGVPRRGHGVAVRGRRRRRSRPRRPST